MKYLTQRYEGDGRLCGPPIEREESPGACAVSLFRFELGYGGKLTKVEPAFIEVRTSMMGRYDITTYTGTEEEMLPLGALLRGWAEPGASHRA